MIKVIKSSQYESMIETLNRINSLLFLLPDFKEIEVIQNYLLDTKVCILDDDFKDDYIHARNTSKTPKQKRKK